MTKNIIWRDGREYFWERKTSTVQKKKSYSQERPLPSAQRAEIEVQIPFHLIAQVMSTTFFVCF